MICAINLPWNVILLQNKQWQIQDYPGDAYLRGECKVIIWQNCRKLQEIELRPRRRASHAQQFGSASACAWCRNRVLVQSWNKLNVHTSGRLLSTCRCQSLVLILPKHTLSHALQLSIIHTLTLIDGSFPFSPTVTHPCLHSDGLLDWVNSTKTFFLEESSTAVNWQNVSQWDESLSSGQLTCNMVLQPRVFYTFYKWNRAAVTRRMCQIKI